MSDRVKIGGVEIDVRADGSLLIADLRNAERQAAGFADRASKDIEDKLGGAFNRLRGAFASLLALGGIVRLGQQAVEAADAFTGMRSRLSLVVKEGENLLAVEESLAQLALRNRADLNATVALYSRLRTSRKDLSDATTQTILDAWNKSLVISGSNAAEAASSTLQFAQAMGSGVLQGVELSAVLEGNVRGAKLIAEGLGVPIGQLKKIASEGKITTDVLIDIFTKAGSLDSEFDKMSMTAAQAGVNFGTALTRVVGLLDQSIGLTAGLASWINSLAQSLFQMGVALGGPIAEAQDATNKLNIANAAIIKDTATLEGAYDRLNKAIKDGGDAAVAAARLEVDAINSRIVKNKELAGTYALIARAKLAEAEERIAQAKRPGGELDRILYEAPQIFKNQTYTAGGLDPVTQKPLPAEQRSGIFQVSPEAELGDMVFAAEGSLRSEELLSRARDKFGNQDQQFESANALIKAMQDKKLPLQDASKRLTAWTIKNAEDLTTIDAIRKSLDILEGGETLPIDPATSTGAPKSDDDKKKKIKELKEYTTAAEEYAAAIKEIREAPEEAGDKSRAALQAFSDYADKVGLTLEDLDRLETEVPAIADLLNDGDWGLLFQNIAKLKDDTGEIRDDEGLVKSYLDENKPDDVLADMERDRRDSAPDFQIEKQYWDDFEEDIGNATKRGLYDAIEEGDYGDLLEDVVGDSVRDGMARAIDQSVDRLFQLLSEFDWGQLFGKGGAGDLLNSAFDFLAGGSRSSGGDMMRNRAYRVGEMGPELFVPKSDGYIIPNQMSVPTTNEGPRNIISIGGTTVNIDSMGKGVTIDELRAELEARDEASASVVDRHIRDQNRRGAFD